MYFGTINKKDYGFYLEKIRDGIFINNEKYKTLLEEQSQGKQIVLYDKEVFAAEQGIYYLDNNGVWVKKDDELFETEKRLEEIEKELKQTDLEYETVMNMPVPYSNGYFYKPKYVEDSYVLLIASDMFPMTIWDVSETNPVVMQKTDLIMLSMYLKSIAEPAFQNRKLKRKTLLQEKQTLEALLTGETE